MAMVIIDVPVRDGVCRRGDFTLVVDIMYWCSVGLLMAIL